MDVLEQLLGNALAEDAPKAGEHRVTALREQIGEIDAEDINFSELESSAVSAFDDAYNGGEFNPDDYPKLEALTDVIDAFRAEIAEAEAARAEMSEKAQALANRIAGTTDDEQPGEDEQADEEPEAESAEADEDQPGEDEQADDDADDEQKPTQGQESPAEGGQVAMKTKGRKVSLSAVNKQRRSARPPQTKARQRMVLTAAADVPGFPTGAQINLDQLTQAVMRKVQSFTPSSFGSQAGTQVTSGLAVIKREHDGSRAVHNSEGDREVIDRVADEKQLPGGSLLAAATTPTWGLGNPSGTQPTANTGPNFWCSPSETDYSLLPGLGGMDGLVDVPTVNVVRGGLRYPVGTDYPVIAAHVNQYMDGVPGATDPNLSKSHIFTQDTEFGHADGQRLKRMLRVPCPTWEEVRLAAIPFWVEGDILQERGYPEFVSWYLDQVMMGHRHWMNALLLKDMTELSEQITLSNLDFGVAFSLGEKISMLVEWFRDLYRLPETATLEAVAPKWMRAIIKQDIARRNARPVESVPDGMIEAVFADHGARVQWVRDWQPFATADPPPPPPPTEAAVAAKRAPVVEKPDPEPKFTPKPKWPTEATLMFYPAGTFVHGQSDIISLSTMYDTTLRAENRYSRLFTEEGYCMFKRRQRAYKVTVPLKAEAISGVTGVQHAVPFPAAAEGSESAASGEDNDSGGAQASSSGRSKK